MVELVRMQRNQRLRNDEGFGLHDSVLEHWVKGLLESDLDSGFVMLLPVTSRSAFLECGGDSMSLVLRGDDIGTKIGVETGVNS